MELEGGTSGVKPIDVDPKDVELHDINSSELRLLQQAIPHSRSLRLPMPRKL